MESKTIKEFLVGIRYVQNESSLRELRTTIGKVSKEIAGIGVGAGAGLAGFIAALNKTSDALAKVYYQAQQAGTSGSQLMKLTYAGNQIGGLGNQLTQMAIGLKQAQRSIPPTANLWGLLGAKAGDTKDTVKALYDIVERYHEILKSGGSQIAERALLGKTGLDPNVVYQLAKNWRAFNQAFHQFATIYKSTGVTNIDQMLKEAVKYQREWNTLMLTFTAGWDHFAVEFMPTFQRIFKDVFHLVQVHEKDIQGFFTQIDTGIKELNQPQNWAQMKHDLGKVAGLLSDITAAVKFLAKHPVIAGMLAGGVEGGAVAGPWGALAGSAFGAGAVLGHEHAEAAPKREEELRKARLRNVFRRMGLLPHADAPVSPPWAAHHNKTAETNQKLRDWLDERTQSPHVEISTHKGVGQRLYSWLMGMGTYIPYVRLKHDAQQQSILSETMKTISRMPGGPASPMTPAGTLPTKAAQQQSLWESIRYFMSKGLTEAQAEGVTARLAKESGGNWLNPDARNKASGAYGIAQWLGSRQPAALATHGSLRQQLALVWHELNTTEKASLAAILASTTPEQAGMAMGSYERANNPLFTRNAARYAGVLAQRFKALSRKSGLVNAGQLNVRLNMPTPVGLAPLSVAGGTNVHYQPNTNINVFGYGPEVGSYVFGTQSRVNADQVRNLTQIIQ